MLLRRERWEVNKKRIYRLYTEEGLQVRTKRRKKYASHQRIPTAKAKSRNECWSMDFVADTLVGGRRFRVLTLVDLYSRKCLALRAGRSLKGADVVQELSRIRAAGRKPAMITVDNGSEFTSSELEGWCYLNDVKLDLIRPGEPVESCFVESFNWRLREECLNANLFFTIAQVVKILTVWMDDYDDFRPHGSLGGIPPSEVGAETMPGSDPAFST